MARTDSLEAGHRTQAPVSGVARFRLEGSLYNRGDPVSRNLFPPAGAGRVAQQAFHTRRVGSFAPQCNRRPAHVEFFRQPMVCFAFTRAEDDPCSQRDFLCHLQPLRQSLPLLRRNFNRLRPTPHTTEDDMKLINGKAIFKTGGVLAGYPLVF